MEIVEFIEVEDSGGGTRQLGVPRGITHLDDTSETDESVGELIEAAEVKTTPTDSDKFSIAESGMLKSLSWSNLKSALNGIFARLAGVAGGQTLIGGTVVGNALTLRGDSASDNDGKLVIANGVVAIGKDASTSGVIPYGYSSSTWAQGVHHRTTNNNTVAAPFYLGHLTEHLYNVTEVVAGFSCNVYNALKTGDEQTFNSTTQLYNNYNYLGVLGTKQRGYCYNVYVNSVYSGGVGATCPYISGVDSWITHNGLGTVTGANALVGATTTRNAAVLTTAWGTEGYIRAYNTSTITNSVSVGAKLLNSAGCTITNAYGVQIGGPQETWSNGGTITNAHALFIGSSTNVGTNKWSIYDESDANKYLKGKVGIGNSDPTAKLDVMATTEQLRLGYDANYRASFTVGSTGTLKIDAPLTWVPAASATPVSNREFTIEMTSDTLVTFKYKGTDGTVRAVSLTMS